MALALAKKAQCRGASQEAVTRSNHQVYRSTKPSHQIFQGQYSTPSINLRRPPVLSGKPWNAIAPPRYGSSSEARFGVWGACPHEPSVGSYDGGGSVPVVYSLRGPDRPHLRTCPTFGSDGWKINKYACFGCVKLLPHYMFSEQMVLNLEYRKPVRQTSEAWNSLAAGWNALPEDFTVNTGTLASSNDTAFLAVFLDPCQWFAARGARPGSRSIAHSNFLGVDARFLRCYRCYLKTRERNSDTAQDLCDLLTSDLENSLRYCMAELVHSEQSRHGRKGIPEDSKVFRDFRPPFVAEMYKLLRDQMRAFF
ncbi:hypothetical protein QBC38DRAFT_450058 [Podospora fimiseda]|uniref:Uncharacterized protein n=1 Tax=Podospora fimiseda TaxID=252190 RepID=A0AAN7BZU2_9PEZI|nr:hypothetical protein QBC38DRAFT_450058 [Podospora fimiseda]